MIRSIARLRFSVVVAMVLITTQLIANESAMHRLFGSDSPQLPTTAANHSCQPQLPNTAARRLRNRQARERGVGGDLRHDRRRACVATAARMRGSPTRMDQSLVTIWLTSRRVFDVQHIRAAALGIGLGLSFGRQTLRST